MIYYYFTFTQRTKTRLWKRICWLRCLRLREYPAKQQNTFEWEMGWCSPHVYYVLTLFVKGISRNFSQSAHNGECSLSSVTLFVMLMAATDGSVCFAFLFYSHPIFSTFRQFFHNSMATQKFSFTVNIISYSFFISLHSFCCIEQHIELWRQSASSHMYRFGYLHKTFCASQTIYFQY